MVKGGKDMTSTVTFTLSQEDSTTLEIGLLKLQSYLLNDKKNIKKKADREAEVFKYLHLYEKIRNTRCGY